MHPTATAGCCGIDIRINFSTFMACLYTRIRLRPAMCLIEQCAVRPKQLHLQRHLTQRMG
jgi:hypothetical protein